MIPFNTLKELLKDIGIQKFHLIFENDRESTVLSFLDLLKDFKSQVFLEFRDQQTVEYYHKMNHAFYWCFHPTGDWENILTLPNLKGLILPTQWKNNYRTLSRLWDIIEQRQLDIFIHTETLAELETYASDRTLKLSADLSREVEFSYRRVDQERLLNLKIWRKPHENIAGQ